MVSCIEKMHAVCSIVSCLKFPGSWNSYKLRTIIRINVQQHKQAGNYSRAIRPIHEWIGDNFGAYMFLNHAGKAKITTGDISTHKTTINFTWIANHFILCQRNIKN